MSTLPTSESSHGEQDDHEAAERRARSKHHTEPSVVEPKTTAMKVGCRCNDQELDDGETTPLSLLCSTIRRLIKSLPSGRLTRIP